ncbi:MAG: hypothetical protein JWM49_1783 [Microbacteriaceae bacterium]|nr:hypothetical protein [Microbacteriaceae bacterium]
METKSFRARDGRTLGVTEFGSPRSEHVIVLCHSAPGSSLFDPDPEATSDRDVRVIAIDRPGYGPSELHGDGSSGSVADAADDVADYLASEGVRRVGAVGWSAGGRVALALAARRSDLVDRVALVGTPAPDEDVPWVGEDNRAALRYLSMLHRGDAVAALKTQFAGMVGDAPSGTEIVPMLTADDADKELRREALPRLRAMLDRGVEQGLIGLAADIVSYTLVDWGFEPSTVAAKTLLLYGGADATVGAAHARWYKDRVRNSRIEVVPDFGHLLIIPMWDRVLSHLAPGSRSKQP